MADWSLVTLQPWRSTWPSTVCLSFSIYSKGSLGSLLALPWLVWDGWVHFIKYFRSPLWGGHALLVTSLTFLYFFVGR